MSPNHLAAGLLHQIELLDHDIISLASAMPEHDYGFAPAAGMRTFGEQLRHLATVVYLTAATMRQEQSRYAPGERNDGPGAIQSKESVLKYLAEAFSEVRAAVGGLTDAAALEPISTYFGLQTRAQLAAGILQHSYNHYGQMVVYARLRNLVPPTSVPA